MQTGVGDLVAYGGGWTLIYQVCSYIKTLSPVCGRHGSMEQERVHRIVKSTKHMFGFAVLRRGIRASEAQQDATRGQEHHGGIVNKFSAIISLNTLRGKAKLCVSV